MKHEINDEHGFQRYFPYRIVDDTCGIPDRDIVIDQYMSGELTAAERDAFDEHTFYCKICFEALRFREELQEIVETTDEQEPAIRPAAVSSRQNLGRQAKSWSWQFALLTLAAIALPAMYFLARFIFVSDVAGSGPETNAWGIALDSRNNSFITGEFDSTLLFDNQQLRSQNGSDIFVAKFDPAGNNLWAKQTSGSGALSGQSGHNQGLGIATDQNENLIITGGFIGEVDFEDIRLKSSGPNANLFIAKYSKNGEIDWIRHASGSFAVAGYDVAADAAGNVIVCGSFAHHNLGGTVMFDSVTIDTRGGNDIFVVKYNPDGKLQWVRTAGSAETPGGDVARAIATDALGNVIIAGQFSGTADFGADTLKSAGLLDLFISKYDADGNLISAVRAGGAGRDEAHDLAVDAQNNILVTGFYSGPEVFFGDIRLEKTPPAGDEINRNLFLAKYDASCRLQWAIPVSGNFTRLAARGLTVDGEGNSFIIGHFTGQIRFPDSDITFDSGNGDDVFIAKFNPDGLFSGAIQIEGDEDQFGMGIIADRRGDVFAVGSYRGKAQFDNTILISLGGRNIFLTKVEALNFQYLP